MAGRIIVITVNVFHVTLAVRVAILKLQQVMYDDL